VMLVGPNEENLIRGAKTLNAKPDFLETIKANVADTQETQEYINQTVTDGARSMYYSAMQAYVVQHRELQTQ
jgi:hypothetical protein